MNKFIKIAIEIVKGLQDMKKDKQKEIKITNLWKKGRIK